MLSEGNRLYIRRILRTRALRIALVLFFIINFLDVLRIHRKIAYEHKHHVTQSHQKGERVYIASMHFNNAEVLREHWNNALLDLVGVLGEKNVFVNIFESGSWDDTKDVLRDLDHQLESRGVARRVEISDITHQDEITKSDRGDGWIDTHRKKGKELRRIPYLSKLRNKTIQDLLRLEKKGVHFDKVLFLNDVIFTVC